VKDNGKMNTLLEKNIGVNESAKKPWCKNINER
jgi:hypothetical protein